MKTFFYCAKVKLSDGIWVDVDGTASTDRLVTDPDFLKCFKTDILTQYKAAGWDVADFCLIKSLSVLA